MDEICPDYNEIKIQTVNNYENNQIGYWVISRSIRDFLATEPDNDITGEFSFRTVPLLDSWDNTMTMKYDIHTNASGPYWLTIPLCMTPKILLLRE